jgi:hypothetical protein
MKQYLVFGGDVYYARGGAGDFVAAFETLEEARALVAENMRSKAEFRDQVHRGEAVPCCWEGYEWMEVAYFDGEKLENV